MSSWLFGDRSARLAGLANRPAGRRRRRAATGVLLRCESLEDRTLLATVNVQVGNDFFSPTPMTIQVGDTIHWVWVGSNHSTTAVGPPPGQPLLEGWDSGIRNVGA